MVAGALVAVLAAATASPTWVLLVAMVIGMVFAPYPRSPEDQ